MGWICPVCGEANGPFNSACIAGPHRTTITATGANADILTLQPPQLAAAQGTAQAPNAHGFEVSGSNPKPQGRQRRSKNSKSYESDPDFCAFYDQFPIHRGKLAAFRAWSKAVAVAPAAVIIEGARRYAADKTRNPDKSKWPEGWLNDRRWEDEIAPSQEEIADLKAKAELERTERRLRGEGEFA